MRPPTSGDLLSFPSLKAPAPDQPLVMAQGLQLWQTPVCLAGQTRFSMLRPLSTMRMLALLLSRVNSSAVKIPAGPAPTTTTSYLSFMLSPHLAAGAKAKNPCPEVIPQNTVIITGRSAGVKPIPNIGRQTGKNIRLSGAGPVLQPVEAQQANHGQGQGPVHQVMEGGTHSHHQAPVIDAEAEGDNNQSLQPGMDRQGGQDGEGKGLFPLQDDTGHPAHQDVA